MFCMTKDFLRVPLERNHLLAVSFQMTVFTFASPYHSFIFFTEVILSSSFTLV